MFLSCLEHNFYIAFLCIFRERWERQEGKGCWSMWKSGQCLLLLLEKEERPGSSSRGAQTTPAQDGHGLTYKMGLTSKDGRECAGIREGRRTSLVSWQKDQAFDSHIAGYWSPWIFPQGTESTSKIHRRPLWGRICQYILPYAKTSRHSHWIFQREIRWRDHWWPLGHGITCRS